jgi:hypothetical protein
MFFSIGPKNVVETGLKWWPEGTSWVINSQAPFPHLIPSRSEARGQVSSSVANHG